MARRQQKLTINTELIKLDIPRPPGTRSNHRWNLDVLKSHKETHMLERIPRAADTKVKKYNFPVLRMILRKRILVSSQPTCSDAALPSSEQTSTGPRNLTLNK